MKLYDTSYSIRMVTVSVIIPIESIFKKREERCILKHVHYRCRVVFCRIGSEEIAIHCSCSAIIVVMTLTTPLYKCTSCTYEHARLHAAATL